MVLDPPLQDIPRLKRDASIRVIEGPENRVIFLVMDQFIPFCADPETPLPKWWFDAGSGGGFCPSTLISKNIL